MAERKDIKRDEKGNIIINNDGTVNVYMFKDRNGESIFGKKVNVPIHSFISHSISHQNTTTGKRNISEAVNANSALITILKGGLELNSLFNIKIDNHLGSFRFLDAEH